MKTAKKVLSLVLSLALVASLAVTAFAAPPSELVKFKANYVGGGAVSVYSSADYPTFPYDFQMCYVADRFTGADEIELEIEVRPGLDYTLNATGSVASVTPGSDIIGIDTSVSSTDVELEIIIHDEMDDTDIKATVEVAIIRSGRVSAEVVGNGKLIVTPTPDRLNKNKSGYEVNANGTGSQLHDLDDEVLVVVIPADGHELTSLEVDGTRLLIADETTYTTRVMSDIEWRAAGSDMSKTLVNRADEDYDWYILPFAVAQESYQITAVFEPETVVPDVLTFTAKYAGITDRNLWTEEATGNDQFITISAPTDAIIAANGVIEMELSLDGVTVDENSYSNKIEKVEITDKKAVVTLKNATFDEWDEADFELVLADNTTKYQISIFGSAAFVNTVTGDGKATYAYKNPLPNDNRGPDTVTTGTATKFRDIATEGQDNTMTVTLEALYGYQMGTYTITSPAADDATYTLTPVADTPGAYELLAKKALIYNVAIDFPAIPAPEVTANYGDRPLYVQAFEEVPNADFTIGAPMDTILADDGEFTVTFTKDVVSIVDAAPAVSGKVSAEVSDDDDKVVVVTVNDSADYDVWNEVDFTVVLEDGVTYTMSVYASAMIYTTFEGQGEVDYDYTAPAHKVGKGDLIKRTGINYYDAEADLIVKVKAADDYEFVSYTMINPADPEAVVLTPDDDANNIFTIEGITAEIYEAKVTFKSTATTTNPDRDRRSPTSGDGSSNYQTTTTTTPSTTVSTVAEATAAEVEAAIAAAGDAADVRLTNKGLTGEQLASIGDRNVVLTTTSTSGAVLTRTWITGGAGMNGLTPGGSTSNQAAANALATFKAYYSNNPIYAFGLNQTGAIGGTAHIALWLGTSIEEPLYAYLYNNSTNSYAPVTCYVDAAGYVHVEVTTGGTLVFTKAPLERK